LAEAGISGLGGAIDEREHLVAYLLGEAPAEEQLRLEREYFVDDAAYERLLVVEDELAYDYLEGRLSPSRRLRFEGAIGATERGRLDRQLQSEVEQRLVGPSQAGLMVIDGDLVRVVSRHP